MAEDLVEAARDVLRKRLVGATCCPPIQEGLHEDHLARFVVEIIGQFDLSRIEAAYTGRG